MELIKPLALRNNIPYSHPQPFTCCLKPPCSRHKQTPQNVHPPKLSRRLGAIAAAASIFLVCRERMANGLEQSSEEAEKGVRMNAESLLEVKGLLEAESWQEAQKVVRKSASNLKKDVYAIIQNKPPSERPLLRKLYSDLFNSVSKLDYAARDKDVSRVWECYNKIVTALDNLLSTIQLKTGNPDHGILPL